MGEFQLHPHAPLDITDRSLVLVSGPTGLLALTADELRVAAVRAREVVGSYLDPSGPSVPNGRAPVGSEPLLDDRGLEAATGVAASWWSAAARRGAVPHYRIGRWVRFRLSEVVDVPRHHQCRQVGHASSRIAAASRRPSKRLSRKSATGVLQRKSPELGVARTVARELKQL
jgi:hypothetical protein